jgi:hypothetical protein
MPFALTVNAGARILLAREGEAADIAIRIAQQYRIVQAEGDRISAPSVAFLWWRAVTVHRRTAS